MRYLADVLAPFAQGRDLNTTPGKAVVQVLSEPVFLGEGLEVLVRLVEEAKRRLRPGGWLICEISPIIAESAMQQLSSANGYEHTMLINDLANQARVIATQRTT